MSRKSSSLFAVILMVSLFGFWSCTGGSSSGDGVGDTTFLESGVKFIYLNKGTGLKVDTGSHVVSHINLIVNTDTIWSTYAADQSQFDFYAKRTSLIAGFDEVVMYAKKGDRLLAIIPPELGYGAEGSGVVPPNATLHFDLDFLKVEEPKLFLSDVLFDKLQTEDVEATLAEYERVKSDTANYNVFMGEWYSLHRRVMEEGAFNNVVSLWEHKLNEGPDLRGSYHMAQAYDSLGKVNDAINTLEGGIKALADTTGSGFVVRYLNRLKAR